MRRLFSLGLGLFLLAAFGLSSESASQARVELAAGSAAQPVGSIYLPCEITVQGENTSSRAIELDLNDSRVKTKSGLWQTMEAAGGEAVCASSTMGLGARAKATQAVCTLEACDQERRYKFKMTYDGNIVWAYYPSANGWTTDTTLDLGDVGRHFEGF